MDAEEGLTAGTFPLLPSFPQACSEGKKKVSLGSLMDSLFVLSTVDTRCCVSLRCTRVNPQVYTVCCVHTRVATAGSQAVLLHSWVLKALCAPRPLTGEHVLLPTAW